MYVNIYVLSKHWKHHRCFVLSWWISYICSSGKTKARIRMGTTRCRLKWPRANLSARARTMINLPQGPQITLPWALLCSCPQAQACHHFTASRPQLGPAPPTRIILILILIFIIPTLTSNTATMSSSTCLCTTVFSTPWQPAWWILAPNNFDHVTAHNPCVKRPINSWNQRRQRQPWINFPNVILKIQFAAELSLLKCCVGTPCSLTKPLTDFQKKTKDWRATSILFVPYLQEEEVHLQH